MRCCAHILNLIVNDGLKDVHNSIVSIWTAVRFVRYSPQRLAKFKKCVEFSKIECEKLLYLDVPTRWNSTYIMLDVAEKFQVAIEKLDFKTINYESKHCFGHDGFNMKQKYNKYWGNINNINQLLYFGVIFDPRYKFEFVDWSVKEMYLDDANFAENLSTFLKENLFHMYNWYKTDYEKQNEYSQSSALEGKKFIDRKNELERYLNETCIDVDDTFDILVWWKQNSSRFPILSKMVRDILATPVSIVSLESAFSTGGRVLYAFRSSLNPQMAEALICAQNWLRSTITQFKDLNINKEFEISKKIIKGIIIFFCYENYLIFVLYMS
uniref:AC9 transposase n=1 Tax=Cajanus cajan TaxID=3821 RepID=A0A151RK89_CAJCA|nr:Putative AC9 transposase [Cajanus cajan]